MNPELHFPKPPFRLVPSLTTSPPPEPVLHDYLRRVRDWRWAVLELVDGANAPGNEALSALSPRVQEWLARLLAGVWPADVAQWALQSPYNLSPFPQDALNAAGSSPLHSALDILRWRAGVEDFLDDVWDVLGEPMLEMDECDTLGAFIRPLSEARLCPFCLTEFPPDQLNVDRHGCLVLAHVRAKWPPMPAKFVQWAREAGTE